MNESLTVDRYRTESASAARRVVVRVVLAVLLVGLVTSCAVSTNPVSGDRRLYGYSWEREVEIGREADEQIVAQYGVYEDSSVVRYVRRVGRDVLAHSHLRGPEVDPQFRETRFTFRVLDSPVVNAFALPGGYVYVTRGLVAYLENEAQLAVVLGHEIAHVAARHSSQQALTQRVGRIGVLGGAILGQELLGVSAGSLAQLGQVATRLLFLSYSREDERESDRLGVEYALGAGYRASEGAGFFSVLRRMGEDREGSLPSFLSTHPDPGGREDRIRELASGASDSTDSLIVGRGEYLNRIEGLVWGEDPRSGYRTDSLFVHPRWDLRVPVPSDWSLSRTARGASFLEPNERAALLVDRLEQATDPEDAARAFVEPEQMRTLDVQARDVGGRSAVLVSADRQADGRTYRILALFVDGEEAVTRLIGYTTRELYSQFRPTFERSLFGVRTIGDPELRDVEPVRIALFPVDREDSFESLVPIGRSPMTVEELSILNQIQPDQRVAVNSVLKIPASPDSSGDPSP